MSKDGVKRGLKKKAQTKLDVPSSLIKDAKKQLMHGNFRAFNTQIIEAEKILNEVKKDGRVMEKLKKMEAQNQSVRTSTEYSKEINKKDQNLLKLERRQDKVEKNDSEVGRGPRKRKNNSLKVQLEDRDEYDF
ncbi:MAG: hypothetical protein ACYDBI_01195 [Thermoplasmataceae archaeon]